MSGRSDADGVSVNERQRGYSGSTIGPADDTGVHMRETPLPVEWTGPDPTRAPPTPVSNIPDVRKSLRKTEEVERDRVQPTAPWAPYAAMGVLLLVVLASAAVAAIRFSQSNTPPPKAPPPPIEDLEGVPVRKGLNGGDQL